MPPTCIWAARSRAWPARRALWPRGSPAASREAFADLIDRALEEKIAFAIFAGDIFDGDWRDAAIALFFNRQIARLAKAGVPIFLLKGNHDANSVVTKSLALPDLAQQFSDRHARKASNCRNCASPCTGAASPIAPRTNNIALAYPAAKARLVQHRRAAQLPRRTPRPAYYAPCSLDDLRAKNYSYWALGHVHAHEVVAQDPWIVFPGNLQGRNIRETGAKGAVLVDVADGDVTGLRRLIVDRARFAEMHIDAAAHDDTASLLRAIEADAARWGPSAEGRLLALRMRLTGAARCMENSPPIRRAGATRSRRRPSAAMRISRWNASDRNQAARPPRPRLDSDFDFAALLDECSPMPDLRRSALAALAAHRGADSAGSGSAPRLSDEIDALLRRGARPRAVFRAERGGGEA